MITREEIDATARMMRIEISDPDEHLEKIQKMIDYFGRLDDAELPDSLEHWLKVGLDSLREDVREPASCDVSGSLKFGGGEHMRSPKLR